MISITPQLLLRIWRGIGWFGIALLLYLSLTPRPPEITVDHGDKLGHALAYAVLLFWWAQLLLTTRSRVWLAAALIALGVVLEYLQGWSGWRGFDYFDMLADTAGVALGWLTASRTANLPALIHRYAGPRDGR